MIGAILAGFATGAGSPSAQFDFASRAVNDSAIDPANASTRIVFNSDGTVDEIEGGTTTEFGRWHPGTPDGSQWEIGYTGTPTDAFTESSAASDAYAVMTTNRQWGYDQTSVGTKTIGGSLTFRVRRVGGSIADTCTISMFCTVNI